MFYSNMYREHVMPSKEDILEFLQEDTDFHNAMKAWISGQISNEAFLKEMMALNARAVETLIERCIESAGDDGDWRYDAERETEK